MEEQEGMRFHNWSCSFDTTDIMFLVPGGTRLVSKLWVRSWNDIETRSCKLEACWSARSGLCGIGVVLGSGDRCIFGSDFGDKSEADIGMPNCIDEV